MTSQERDCVTRGHARPHLQETPPIQRGQAPCQGAHNGCRCSTPTHRTLRHLLLQEISDVIITKMTRSKVFLHLVPFPFFFTTAEGKERELGDGHLSWSSWPCIFKQAKSQPPPFFSEAIYPPKSMFAVQQPGKNEKFRPGSYLSPPSNAAILLQIPSGFMEDSKNWEPKRPGMA